MNLFSELRIMFAELLLIYAQQVMPSHAPEAKPLKEALDGYFPQSAQIVRWEKFPA